MTSRKRYIHIPTEALKDPYSNQDIQSDIISELARAFTSVQRHALHVDARRHESIYTGITGVALLEYRLAELKTPPELLSVSPDSLVSNGDQRIAAVLRERGINRHVKDTGHASFIETDIGIATLVLKRFPWTSERAIREHWQSCEYLLQNAVSNIDKEDRHISEDNCEVLYGRAGLLYALLSLRSTYSRKANVDELDKEAVESITPLFSDETIGKVMDSIIRRGKYGAEEYSREVGDRHGISLPPLMWAWHYKRYLGGAHGIAGILHVLLRCPEHLLAKHIESIVATIEWLIECQGKDGNWPTKAPDKHELPGENVGDLVQWCHGAPSILILLATLLRRSKEGGHEFQLSSTFEDTIQGSIAHGASLVYHHGLLCKGVGLCHGVAGSVFALLAAADVSKEPENQKYFSRAVHLAHLATQHEKLTLDGKMRVPDHPWSLYEGMAGMCCAWGEIITRLKTSGPRAYSGMPGFDDL